MENTEKIDFFQISNLNNLFYKLTPFTIEEKEENNSFHTKISQNDKNILSSENEILKSKKRSKDQINTLENQKNKIKKLKKLKKNENKSPKKKLLSTVKNFNILVAKIPTLKLKEKKLLENKFKNLYDKKRHIFFYFNKNKLVLVYKNYTFRNGQVLINSLISHNITGVKKKKKIKKFYKLIY